MSSICYIDSFMQLIPHYIARVMESTLSRQRTQCGHQFYGQLKSNGIRDYLPFRIDGSVQYYLRLRGVAVFLLPLVAENPNLLKFLPHTREIQSKTDTDRGRS